jgi:hypothetical protein
MPKLNSEHIAFIVTRLACYHSSSEVMEAFKEQFGFDIKSNQVAYYTPITKTFTEKDLTDKWRKLFFDTRRDYRKRISDIPISLKVYRLSQLQMMLDEAMESGNFQRAMQLLNIAKEESNPD